MVSIGIFATFNYHDILSEDINQSKGFMNLLHFARFWFWFYLSASFSCLEHWKLVYEALLAKVVNI